MAQILRKWLAATGAKTLYVEPGYRENFNSKLRDESLNREIFYSLKEMQVLAERWRVYYNTRRSHSSLGYRPPEPTAWQNEIGIWKVESKEGRPSRQAVAPRFPQPQERFGCDGWSRLFARVASAMVAVKDLRPLCNW